MSFSSPKINLEKSAGVCHCLTYFVATVKSGMVWSVPKRGKHRCWAKFGSSSPHQAAHMQYVTPAGATEEAKACERASVKMTENKRYVLDKLFKMVLYHD